MPKGKLAAYEVTANEIWISSVKPKGGWVKHLKEREASGHSSHANSILHEFGHYIHSILAPRDYDTSGYNRPAYSRPPAKEIIMAQLSQYATVSTKEYEAELMAGILSGKVYPPEIINGSYLRDVSLSEGGADPKAQALKRMATGKIPNTSATEQKFAGTMKVLFQQKGSQFQIDILANDKVQDFISSHAQVLDNAFKFEPMSDAMRQRLQRSNYIFSGMKTFHELNEAFPSLIDENGNRKPFEQFLNDVQRIDRTYNQNYLRAEYNFCQASADMAAKWEGFMQDGDRYNLQYRTQRDKKVRPAHAALDRVTLPMSDPFWQEYYPPNGWNCRCTVVQVRKSKYPVTPHDEAMALGEEATGKDTKGIFHFNPGIEQKTIPDYNPYTIKRCRDCDIAKGKLKLAFVPDNEVCAACELLHRCAGDNEKSATAIERTHYLHEMEPLLQIRHEKPIDEGTIKVGFSTYGNKHLFSDTFGRSRVLLKEDLKDLGALLENSTYIDDSALTHPRADNIEHFYYYKAELHGRTVRLNVAKEVKHRDSGHIVIKYYLYSINDINE